MKQIGDMKLYNFEELLDEDLDKIGTPERDEFERSVDESVQAYKMSIDDANPEGVQNKSRGCKPPTDRR